MKEITLYNLQKQINNILRKIKCCNSFIRFSEVKTTTSALSTTSNLVFASGTITLTLPIGTTGQIITIKNVSTGTITVTPPSGTIDTGTGAAAATASITDGLSQTFTFNGTAWYKI